MGLKVGAEIIEGLIKELPRIDKEARGKLGRHDRSKVKEFSKKMATDFYEDYHQKRYKRRGSLKRIVILDGTQDMKSIEIPGDSSYVADELHVIGFDHTAIPLSDSKYVSEHQYFVSSKQDQINKFGEDFLYQMVFKAGYHGGRPDEGGQMVWRTGNTTTPAKQKKVPPYDQIIEMFDGYFKTDERSKYLTKALFDSIRIYLKL